MTFQYIPEKIDKDTPLVIALPGLITEKEATQPDARMHIILEQLRKEGVLGLLHSWTEITQQENGKYETCDFNLRETAVSIPFIIKEMAQIRGLKDPLVGLITNSLSALIGNIVLANSWNHNYGLWPRSYASMAPITGWTGFLDEKSRDLLVKAGKGIVIGKFGGRPRLIPAEKVPSLVTLDYKEQLNGYDPTELNVMTLLGSMDKTSDPKKIIEYHGRLGGLDENLRIYGQEGHDINGAEKDIVPFMLKTLRR